MPSMLLKLTFIFLFASLLSAATNPLIIPASEAPGYCSNIPGPTQFTTPGSAPYAVYGVPPIDYDTAGFSNTALGIALLALTLSFDTIALAYILSRLVPSLGIRNWLQGEYWELAKSAILLCVIWAMITIIGNLSYVFLQAVPPFANPPPTPPTDGDITPLINGAMTYLCNTNYNIMDIWSWMGLLGAGTGFWSNFRVGTYNAITVIPALSLISGSIFVPFNNWMLQTGNPMIAFYGSIIGDTINLLLFPLSIMTITLIDVLPQMVEIGLMFFVPLGLIFRALPFVRGIGGTLIAVGLGMAVILPAVLIMFNGVFMNYIQQALPIAPPPPPDLTGIEYGGFNAGINPCPISGFEGEIDLATFPIGSAACGLLLPSIIPGAIKPWIVYAVTDEHMGYLDGANVFSNTAVYQYMDIMLSIASYVIMQLVVITIDLVLIYALTDSVARSLGGSIRLQLGGKLRIAS